MDTQNNTYLHVQASTPEYFEREGGEKNNVYPVTTPRSAVWFVFYSGIWGLRVWFAFFFVATGHCVQEGWVPNECNFQSVVELREQKSGQ